MNDERIYYVYNYTPNLPNFRKVMNSLPTAYIYYIYNTSLEKLVF